MRTIKFRGKFIYPNTNGSLRWVYGDLFQSEMLKNIGKAKIFETIEYDGETYSNSTEVLLGTVGQFTGLYDYKGNEIYEGDIIRSFSSKGEPIDHIVGYDENDARFTVQLKGHSKDDFGYSGLYKGWIQEFKKEVIGNTFDNPDLLR